LNIVYSLTLLQQAHSVMALTADAASSSTWKDAFVSHITLRQLRVQEFNRMLEEITSVKSGLETVASEDLIEIYQRVNSRLKLNSQSELPAQTSGGGRRSDFSWAFQSFRDLSPLLDLAADETQETACNRNNETDDHVLSCR